MTQITSINSSAIIEGGTHLAVRWDADSDPTKPGWVVALKNEDGSFASAREWQPVDAPGDADDEDLIDAAHDTARFEMWARGEVRITRP